MLGWTEWFDDEDDGTPVLTDIDFDNEFEFEDWVPDFDPDPED